MYKYKVSKKIIHIFLLLYNKELIIIKSTWVSGNNFFKIQYAQWIPATVYLYIPGFAKVLLRFVL